MTQTLNEKTLKLLRNRPNFIKFKQIEEDTGIPKGWMYMYAKGKITDPSVNRIEILHKYLTEITNAITTTD